MNLENEGIDESLGIKPGFKRELEQLLNRYGWDNTCGTPDFILADHIEISLLHFRDTLQHREKWFGRSMDSIGKTPPLEFIQRSLRITPEALVEGSPLPVGL